MKEIKFRAWDKEDKIMRTVTSVIIDPIYSRAEYGMITPTHIDIVLPTGKFTNDYERFSLMQYTGLFDLNGKEIYVSDILKFDKGDTGIIKMDDYLEIFFAPIGEPECEDQWRDLYRISNAEIIGTIYENPELLK